MPSDFLTPFLELDEEFCKSFRGLEVTDGPSAGGSQQHQQQQQTQAQRVSGFQRRHSLCPVTLPNSKFNAGSCEGPDQACCWGLNNNAAPHQHWSRDRQQQLPRSSLNHIPFRVDRSVSMIEGHGGAEERTPTLGNAPHVLLPPPGLSISSTSLSSSSSSSAAASPSCSGKPLAPSPPITTRYKTELCRTFEESGTCKYGAKCQFAHGLDELRGLSRHPKYKTEPCRTFHTVGFCPYGARCHFVHNAEEGLASPGSAGGAPPPQRQKLRPPLLRQSVSFAGFSSAPQAVSSSSSSSGFQPVREPPAAAAVSSLLFARASSVSPPPSSSGSPELLSPLFPEPGALKHCAYPFSGVPDLASSGGGDAPLRFYAVTDSSKTSSSSSALASKAPRLLQLPHQQHQGLSLPGLQRCSSADSLSEEGYTSSCSLSSSSSGSESPSFEGRRLPIFSRLSVSDE